MPFSLLKLKLTSRGYWEEANGGDTGGGAGGSEGGDDSSEGGDGSSGSGDEGASGAGDEGASSDKPTEKEAALLKENMKRKQQNKELQAKVDELATQLKKFDGIDLDSVTQLLNAQKDAEVKKLEEKGQWDALKKQMSEENSKLISAKETEIGTLKEQLLSQQSIIDKLTLGNAFANSQFIKNELNLSPEKTKIIYGTHFEIEGDQVVAYDKPKGAKDRVPLVNASGDNLSFEDAIKKIVEQDADKNLLIKSKQKAGSGSGTTNQKPVAKEPEKRGVSKIEAALADAKKQS